MAVLGRLRIAAAQRRDGVRGKISYIAGTKKRTPSACPRSSTGRSLQCFARHCVAPSRRGTLAVWLQFDPGLDWPSAYSPEPRRAAKGSTGQIGTLKDFGPKT